jgi:hypothetical protein
MLSLTCAGASVFPCCLAATCFGWHRGVGLCARQRSGVCHRSSRVSPRRAPHFSCFAKKSKQKKASRSQGRCAVPCAARDQGEAQKLALRAQTSSPLIPWPLRCSALPGRLEKNSQNPIPKDSPQTRTRHGASLWGSGLVLAFTLPRRDEAASSAGADGSGLALFERSEFSQTPAGPSNAACPQGRRIRLAFSLVTFFWRSKRKLLRGRAHHPTPTTPPEQHKTKRSPGARRDTRPRPEVQLQPFNRRRQHPC